jgi:DNA-directed RNA polymerase specialized sigma24 family protein
MNRYGSDGRMNVTIDRIENGFAHGRTDRGRQVKLALRVLRFGLRGSRLNGTPERLYLPSPDPAPKPTVRVYKPKSLAKASPEAMEALRLQQKEGLPIYAIAQRLGCSMSAVTGRLRRAREAQKEERNGHG